MWQRWERLLFLHWDYDPAAVQATLPPGLTVDTFEDRAYVGVVPFFMCGVRPRGLPAVPWLSDFLELNVRTYVRDASGRPGVWFYSLDCDQPVAVRIARTFFALPYFDATMSARRSGEKIHYACKRSGAVAGCSLEYGPTGIAAPAESGSLEEFLVERYRLFSARRGRLFTGCVWHPPYGIAKAAFSGDAQEPLRQAGFPTGDRPPVHAAFSPGVRVKIFAPSAVR